MALYYGMRYRTGFVLVYLLLGASAFALDKYHATEIGDFGAGTMANGMSPTGGLVTGFSWYADNHRAPFLWSPGSSMVDLGTGSGNEGVGNAVNSQGAVVGFTTTGAIHPHAFLYENGSLSQLNVFGNTETIAYGINDQKQIAGWWRPEGGNQHAFKYANGTATDLGTLHNFGNSIGYAINGLGDVVGVSDVPGDATGNAFIYTDGTMKDLGNLGGSYAYALGVNDSRMVVGSSLIRGNEIYHAFSYFGNQMTDLGSLGGDAAANAVNASGVVVGTSLASDGFDKATLFSGGAVYDLNNYLDAPLGYRLWNATAVDNSGRILVQGVHATGAETSLKSFVLTPVPEPSTFVVFGVGALACCYSRRRVLRRS